MVSHQNLTFSELSSVPVEVFPNYSVVITNQNGIVEEKLYPKFLKTEPAIFVFRYFRVFAFGIYLKLACIIGVAGRLEISSQN